ncbi:hypothetical protein J5N97_014679 [Dioscorea zingiberensis]|uniref:Uncharacterized protein n=1 Tax=Dioscorea zingiberensis TaxID=325984 RepID=A0A9D5CSV6_9LILI|nr:hypothetical protein J5N97_014679 [Dioscorea zingiberensis]
MGSIGKGELMELRTRIAPDSDLSLGLSNYEGNGGAGSEEIKEISDDREFSQTLSLKHLPAGPNVLDLLNMVGQKSLCPNEKLQQLELANASECGSSIGVEEDSEALRIWKEMKRNGFLSSSHGGLSMAKHLDPQCSKKKYDVQKKKAERTKKEKVDRFTKFAPPSESLSGFKPGIINHVKNTEQVRSKIEATLQSANLYSQIKNGYSDLLGVGSVENNDKSKEQKNAYHLACNQFTLSLSNPVSYISAIPPCNTECDNTPKSPLDVTIKSEKSMGGSYDEPSANKKTVNILSLKGAFLASLWLELLQLNIQWRLAVLRRSKKRLRNVINAELPCLLSVEFSSNQGSRPCSEHSSIVDIHLRQWKSLYNQMGIVLNEDEKHLENWLIQVQKMKVRCDKGLKYASADGLPLTCSSEDARLRIPDKLELECLIRAAAASIYSTCNLIVTRKNAA